MDSLTLAFALAGLDAMKLGKGNATDLLAVSLSTTDAIGHAFGPDSREVHDQVLRLDRYLGWFLDRLFAKVGRDRVLIALSADHGVTPYPEFSQAHGHPEARWVSVDTVVAAVNQQIDRAMATPAPRTWLYFDTGLLFVRDNGQFGAQGLRRDSLLAEAARRLRAVPGVARVDFPDSLASADTVADPVARRWRHHVPPDAGIGLVVTLAPWDAWSYSGGVNYAAHGQPTDLDAHVPLILWGKGVRGGTYGARVSTVDIAPTLARLMGLAPLSIPDGRVLTEAIAP
jgi:predicted AlkP superfamily pyrophosphatase or phosphodiesterase